MLLKDLMTILIIIGIIAFAAGGFYYSLNQEYNNETTEIELIEEYGESLNAAKNATASLYNQTQTSGISAGGITGVLFSGIGSFFQVLLQAITTPIRLIVLTAEQFGIPQEIYIGVVTLLILGATIAVISAILKKTP